VLLADLNVQILRLAGMKCSLGTSQVLPTYVVEVTRSKLVALPTARKVRAVGIHT